MKAFSPKFLRKDPIKILIFYNLILWIFMTVIYLILDYVHPGSFHFPITGDHTLFVDILYFSLITHTTVGYGDIVPTTKLAKIFVCIHVFSVWVVNLGFVWLSVHESVTEITNQAVTRAINETRHIELSSFLGNTT